MLDTERVNTQLDHLKDLDPSTLHALWVITVQDSAEEPDHDHLRAALLGDPTRHAMLLCSLARQILSAMSDRPDITVPAVHELLQICKDVTERTPRPH